MAQETGSAVQGWPPGLHGRCSTACMATLLCAALHTMNDAERLKTKLLEEDHLVDLVAGPDAYRDLPRMLAAVEQDGQAQVCKHPVTVGCTHHVLYR